MSEVLRIEGVTKRFGGLVAVDRVSLAIARGSITAIIGSNGAGKTTLINIISGVIYPDEGRVYFEGHDITRKPPHERARLGIARSFQNIGIIPSLTVIDHIKASILGSKNPNPLKLVHPHYLDSEELYNEVYKVLEMVGLRGREWRLALHLTQAEQRKLDIAMAIASKPKLVLMDEPTSGLAAEDIPSVINLLKSLRESNRDLTVVLVEHKLEVVRDLAERVVVMKEGKIIADGTYSSVMSNREVIETYIGAQNA